MAIEVFAVLDFFSLPGVTKQNNMSFSTKPPLLQCKEHLYFWDFNFNVTFMD